MKINLELTSFHFTSKAKAIPNPARNTFKRKNNCSVNESDYLTY